MERVHEKMTEIMFKIAKKDQWLTDMLRFFERSESSTRYAMMAGFTMYRIDSDDKSREKTLEIVDGILEIGRYLANVYDPLSKIDFLEATKKGVADFQERLENFEKNIAFQEDGWKEKVLDFLLARDTLDVQMRVLDLMLHDNEVFEKFRDEVDVIDAEWSSFFTSIPWIDQSASERLMRSRKKTGEQWWNITVLPQPTLEEIAADYVHSEKGSAFFEVENETSILKREITFDDGVGNYFLLEFTPNKISLFPMFTKTFMKSL